MGQGRTREAWRATAVLVVTLATSCGGLAETGVITVGGDAGQAHDTGTRPSHPDATTRDTGGTKVDAGHDATTPKHDAALPKADSGVDAADAAPPCSSQCAVGDPCTTNVMCASDVCTLGACAPGATLFAGDLADGKLLRYTVAQDAGPSLSTEVDAAHANGAIVDPAGNLLVGDFTDGTLLRFRGPYGTIEPIGSLSGVEDPQALTRVDDEVWVANSGKGEIDRVAFGDGGAPMLEGKITDHITDDIRQIAWYAEARVAYVTLCCGTNDVLVLSVAADHTASLVATLTGNGLDNPNGVVVSPWNELFVANSGAGTILRYTLDASGNATPHGIIAGNGLSVPVAMAFTPWGELYVTNQGTNTLSRFTFDETHTVTPNGTFSPAPYVTGGWLWIAP
jgi:hypothetical protein